MKKTFYKIKLSLATLWIAIISFSSKVISQFHQFGQDFSVPSVATAQTVYWVPPQELGTKINAIVNAIKRFRIPLIIVIFIVWIVNFIKIRKIEDKNLKKKKIKNTAIIILIISIIILLMSISARLIKKYYD